MLLYIFITLLHFASCLKLINEDVQITPFTFIGDFEYTSSFSFSFAITPKNTSKVLSNLLALQNNDQSVSFLSVSFMPSSSELLITILDSNKDPAYMVSPPLASGKNNISIIAQNSITGLMLNGKLVNTYYLNSPVAAPEKNVSFTLAPYPTLASADALIGSCFFTNCKESDCVSLSIPNQMEEKDVIELFERDTRVQKGAYYGVNYLPPDFIMTILIKPFTISFDYGGFYAQEDSPKMIMNMIDSNGNEAFRLNMLKNNLRISLGGFSLTAPQIATNLTMMANQSFVIVWINNDIIGYFNITGFTYGPLATFFSSPTDIAAAVTISGFNLKSCKVKSACGRNIDLATAKLNATLTTVLENSANSSALLLVTKLGESLGNKTLNKSNSSRIIKSKFSKLIDSK
jgi:hypothetical protein